MTRIYLSPIDIHDTSALIIDGKNAHHLITVLRCKTGDKVTLFDGGNSEYEVIISQIKKKSILVTLLEKKIVQRESPLAIHLIQGISKGERMDWVMQKATELGVSRITPIYSQHGAVSLNADRMLKKQEHWQNIIISACKQCGRNTLPHCDPIQSFSDAVSSAPPENCARWILDPHQIEPIQQKIDLRSTCDTIQLLIGPEGGFSSQEVTQAHAAGFNSLKLGPRILRTETAAIAAIASLQAMFGDLFPPHLQVDFKDNA